LKLKNLYKASHIAAILLRKSSSWLFLVNIVTFSALLLDVGNALYPHLVSLTVNIFTKTYNGEAKDEGF
jgi:hypothetical protein